MAAIQHTKFHFFIGKHVRDEHRPCFIPVRTTGNEIIFDNPLTEILAYDAAGSAKPIWSLIMSNCSGVIAGTMRSTMVPKGDMLRYPCRQLRIKIIGKRNDRRFGQMTVFRNVIARQYTKRGSPCWRRIRSASTISPSADRGCSGSARSCLMSGWLRSSVLDRGSVQ